MPDVKVRDATETDINAMVDIYLECFSQMGIARLGGRSSRRYFQGMLRSPLCHIFIAQDESGVLGFIIAILDMQAIRKWNLLLACGGFYLEAILLPFRHPSWVLERGAKALRGVFGTKSGAEAAPAPGAERFKGRKVMWLESIGVTNAARRKGVGSALLSHVFSVARELGFECLKAAIDNQNRSSQALVERHGFVKTAEYPTRSVFARDCN